MATTHITEEQAALIQRLTLIANEPTPNGVRSYLQADVLALLAIVAALAEPAITSHTKEAAK
jgi:hypothetical protein